MTGIEELSIEPDGANATRGTETAIGPDGTGGHHGARYRRHREKRILRDTWLVIVAVALSAIILIGAYLAISAAIVANEVRLAAAEVSDVRGIDLTADGSAAKLKTTADGLRRHVDAAYAHTSNPIWAMMAHAPRYGGDVQAVRDVVDALHTVADDALPPMADAADDVNVSAIGVTDGTISVPGLDTAAPKLARANQAVQRANRELQSIDGVTLGALQRRLEPARKQFLTFARLSDDLSRAAQVLPGMLGTGGGTRNYLVLAQNNAEIRATGGIAGSLGLVTVSDGHVEMHDFVPASGFGELDQPVVELTDGEKQIYGDRLGEFMQDVNFTPDFSRASQLAASMWNTKYGDRIDGVIAIDPVFLQRMLAVAGSVRVTQGAYAATLDGTNTVSTLLSDVYRNLPDNDDQDAFFSAASKAAFDKLLHSSGVDAAKLASQAVAAAGDGHLNVWSANENEQKLLAGTTVGGTLVTKDSGAYLGMAGAAPKQVIGVYYNDSMASKMDWYLSRDVTDKVTRTYADGREEHEVTITMRNTLDASQVDSLPGYVVGTLENGATKGSVQFITYLYAPAGGGIPSYEATGGVVNGSASGTKGDVYALHDGLTVIGKQLSIAPGQTATIRATVVTAPGTVAGQTVVRETPRIR
ncbi:DUF4012 domain-containing protein [Bifidobacterium parmae]|uniref:DUF4012 domain-containing protein n=1 Tax=Bifidobacterium parmae TaxID=361854 RepID=UPI001054FCFF|nr:DUF4012 domain-containing protein [Bifidobacterium parmae]